MNTINQDNFNIEVEKKVEKIAVNLIKCLLVAALIIIFMVLLIGAISETKITQNTILLSITPLAIIGIIGRAYISTILKSKIELRLAKSIGYNKAQMEKALKNPNYKEHTALY